MKIELRIGGRRSGRTTDCIKWAAEHNAYIVCANHNQARRIADQAREMDLNIRFPITFDEARDMRGSFPTTFAVDNADLFLRYVLEQGRHTVGYATWESSTDVKELI